jgi:hypothetical protein
MQMRPTLGHKLIIDFITTHTTIVDTTFLIIHQVTHCENYILIAFSESLPSPLEIRVYWCIMILDVRITPRKHIYLKCASTTSCNPWLKSCLTNWQLYELDMIWWNHFDNYCFKPTFKKLTFNNIMALRILNDSKTTWFEHVLVFQTSF